MLLDSLKDLKRKIATAISPKREDPQDPDDPFALVGARLKPRPPLNSSSVAVEPE